MPMIFEDEGCVQLAKAYLQNVWPSGGKDLTLKLFVNDVTPSVTGADAAAAFTEANGGGYAAITLTNGLGWTVSTVGGIVQGAYAQQTWTFTGALTTNPTIYGWFLVDADNNLVAAQRNSTSFTPATNGETTKATPVIQFSYGTPAA
jgi:hypothetical protein